MSTICISKPIILQKLLKILGTVGPLAELKFNDGEITIQSINQSRTILYVAELNPNLIGESDFSGSFSITLADFLKLDLSEAIEMNQFKLLLSEESENDNMLKTVEAIPMINAIIFDSAELQKNLSIMEKKHNAICLETCKEKRGFNFQAREYDPSDLSKLISFKDQITQRYTNSNNAEFSTELTDFMAKRIKSLTTLPTKRFWLHHSEPKDNGSNLILLQTICNEFKLKMYLGSREPNPSITIE